MSVRSSSMLKRRPITRTVSVDVEVSTEVELFGEDVLAAMSDAEVLELARERKLPVFEYDELAEISDRLHACDFQGVLILLDRLFPQPFRGFEQAFRQAAKGVH